eukprot:evm.model.scf_693.3 EVM.evm.TU.scf_693.3   scf_693:12245-15185(-)
MPALRPRRSVVVVASTRWSLELDQGWCDTHKRECDRLEASMDLSETISAKLGALVGETKDCDFDVACNRTGVKVLFESVGAANPIDSPAELYVTDIGGRTQIYVDGEKLRRSQKVKLHPGSKIGFGDFAMFEVHRNLKVHA